MTTNPKDIVNCGCGLGTYITDTQTKIMPFWGPYYCGQARNPPPVDVFYPTAIYSQGYYTRNQPDQAAAYISMILGGHLVQDGGEPNRYNPIPNYYCSGANSTPTKPLQDCSLKGFEGFRK